MAVSVYYNRVKYTPASAGTGDFVTSAVVTGFRTPATASIADGSIVAYVAFSSDQSEWETGQGAYTVATTTLARTTVRESSNAGAKVNFSAAPTVALDFQAQDITNLPPVAIGGATLGTNALAVTGTANISGNTTLGSAALLLWSTDVNLSRNAAGVIQFGTTAANAAGSWLATNGTLSSSLTFTNGSGIVFGQSNRIVFNIGGVGGVAIDANGTGGLTIGSGYNLSFTSGTITSSIDTTITRNAAGVVQFGTTAANASGAWLAAKGTLTGGTLVDQAQVLAITATQPASPSTTQSAIKWSITSAGSANQENDGFFITYNAGYTGSNYSIGMTINNSAAGTGAAAFSGGAGNYGAFQVSQATTTGHNVGSAGASNGGVVNIGTYGEAVTNKNSGTNIGIVGRGLNGGTSPIQIGGFFSLNQTTVPTVSAALIADNGSQSNPIFLGRAANVTVFTVDSVGSTIIASTVDSTTTTSGSVQVAGGMAVRKRIFADGLTASAGLQTAVICQSSAGELIADSVACLASSARFKDLLGDAEKGALGKIIRVPVQRWKYRREEGSVFPDNYYSEHIGPTAEDIEAIDSRLVGRDKEGKVRSISTDQLLALAIQAIQEQQVQIEELKARAA